MTVDVLKKKMSSEKMDVLDKLTPRQARFIEEFAIDLNRTQAAIRAGYSAKTAEAAGSRLLTNVKVAAALAKLQAKVSEKCEISREENIKRWKAHAFVTLDDYMEVEKETGRPKFKAFKEWSERAKASIQEFQIIELAGGAGLAYKAKLYNAQVGLKNLGEINGDYVERKEIKHSGEVDFTSEDLDRRLKIMGYGRAETHGDGKGKIPSLH